jgi:hypothetical protein
MLSSRTGRGDVQGADGYGGLGVPLTVPEGMPHGPRVKAIDGDALDASGSSVGSTVPMVDGRQSRGPALCPIAEGLSNGDGLARRRWHADTRVDHGQAELAPPPLVVVHPWRSHCDRRAGWHHRDGGLEIQSPWPFQGPLFGVIERKLWGFDELR